MSTPVTLGTGRAVAVLGAGFAGSPAHAALAERFAITALSDAADLNSWIADAVAETVGLVGLGGASADVLAAAAAAAGRVGAVVLVSPWSLAASELARAVETPKALLVGSADLRTGPGALSRLKKAFSRASAVMVFGAGEDVARDCPAAFASAAGDFLDRQGRFAFAAETVAINR